MAHADVSLTSMDIHGVYNISRESESCKSV